jgi:hypothetical protein
MEKRDLLKLFQEWEEEEIRENDGVMEGVNSTMINIVKTFVNATMYP